MKTAPASPSKHWYEAISPRRRLLYVALIAMAPALLTWAYFDAYSREQDGEMGQMRLSVQKLADQNAGPFVSSRVTMLPDTGESGQRTYSGALGQYPFQLDLPAGYHLSVSAGTVGDARAYVMMDATVENETPPPDMVISLVDLSKGPYAAKLGKKDEPWTRLVPATDGKAGFWITGWEDLAWPEFDKVAASFKAL